MPITPSRIEAFIQEVQREGMVWAVHGPDGIPVAARASGRGASPFWSTEALARRFTDEDGAYAGFDLLCISWKIFRDRWIQGLVTDGLLIEVDAQPGDGWPCDVDPHEFAAYMQGSSHGWQPAAGRAAMPACRAA
jgi:hypothetical protein